MTSAQLCAPMLGAVLSVLTGGCLASDSTGHVVASEAAVLETAVVAKGSICAAEESHAASCVPSGGDIRQALKGAERLCAKNCTKYQIWPEFPAGATFEQGVRNVAMVQQLLRDADRIERYARKNMKVDGYRRVISGWLADVLQRVKDEQTKAQEAPLPEYIDTISEFENELKRKADSVIDPATAEQISLKQELSRVKAVLTWAEGQLERPSRQYARLVRRFNSYRSSEKKRAEELDGFVERASEADLDALAELSVELADYAASAGDRADTLSIDAARLRSTFTSFDREYHNRVDRHRAIAEEHLGEIPDPTSSVERSLANMVAYCQGRRTQVDQAIAQIANGIAARKQALIALATDEATRDILREQAFLRASGDFLDQATEWRRQLSALPPRTSSGFYLWSDRHELYLQILQLEPLCSAEADEAYPAWRDAGCNAMRRQFGIARTYLGSAMPHAIRLAVSQLRNRGVSEELLTSISTHLNEGRLREAIEAHDAAALSTEEG